MAQQLIKVTPPELGWRMVDDGMARAKSPDQRSPSHLAR